MSQTAPATPVSYMERTRLYYRALGYETDYVWAHNEEVPFARPVKPNRQLAVALATTAGPPDRSNRDAQNRKEVWSSEVAKPPVSFDTDVAWDKESTHTDDRETFLPIDAVNRLVADGTLGKLSARFHCIPTEYSHRKTKEHDAPELLRRLREDKVDAAILVALCPVCHQSMSLVARHLEANGVPTVVVGSALDVVEHCGVPRFLFSDFPLGNPCGHPWNKDMQTQTMRLALSLLQTATAPRTTARTPFDWKPDPEWRDRYARVRPEDREKLFAMGDERRKARGQPPRLVAKGDGYSHRRD
jgi:D-proline reductase (dithiol) PrdB